LPSREENGYKGSNFINCCYFWLDVKKGKMHNTYITPQAATAAAVALYVTG